MRAQSNIFYFCDDMFLDELVDKRVDKYLRERELSYFSITEKVFLYRELAYLIEWWVAIADAVAVVKNGTDKWSIRKICDEMYAALSEWETLSYSMTQLPRYFNEGDVNIIKSWEESGELTRVLKYLAEEYEFLHRIKSKYVGAMIYPSLLFSVAILAVFLLFTKILPGIFDMIASFPNVTIPPMTKFLIGVTNILSNNIGSIFIRLIILTMFCVVVFSSQEGKRILDKSIYRLPLLGKLSRYYDMIKFMRYMRLLMQSGMNFLEVFLFLRDIMSNLSYKVMIVDVIAAINRGDTVGSVLNQYSEFISKDVVALLKVGEETASFESALANAIGMYEEEFNKLLDGLSKVIEPVLIVFIWGIIAMVAMSVFGVIGSLLDGVQSQ